MTVQACVITIGDEILIGQIVDTNAAGISRRLNAIGVTVTERTSIGDRGDRIAEAVTRALQLYDITIITGGLGPTKDDITKSTLAGIFSSDMVRNQAVADHVRTMLQTRGIAYNELNQSQSMVPRCCTVLFNRHGTAPGMWFERDGHIVVSLPGVPFEMEHLMDDEVLPRLRERFDLRQIVHRTMITSGLAESILAERIAEWESSLPPHLHLAYLPSASVVRLRLSAYEVDGESVANEIDACFEALRKLIPQHILGFENATLQAAVHELLTSRGKSLAVAESCTGGSIAARFTAMPGASAYFLLGAVTYSNRSKVDVLGVPAETIERYGAVSEQVARAMAEGVRRISGADYGVSTTGIAGPSGGTADKPVGTVWIAVSSAAGTVAVMKQSGTDRGQIIERASGAAVALLRDKIINN